MFSSDLMTLQADYFQIAIFDFWQLRLLWYAHNLCKQFGARSGPREENVSSDMDNDTLIVFLKEILKHLILKKVSRRQQKA